MRKRRNPRRGRALGVLGGKEFTSDAPLNSLRLSSAYETRRDWYVQVRCSTFRQHTTPHKRVNWRSSVTTQTTIKVQKSTDLQYYSMLYAGIYPLRALFTYNRVLCSLCYARAQTFSSIPRPDFNLVVHERDDCGEIWPKKQHGDGMDEE